MIKVELLESITPKQEVSRAKISESKTSFKDVLSRETNKISNNNTNKINKAIEKTSAKEKDKSLTKAKTPNTNNKKIKENNQKANNEENKKAKVEDKEKKTKANKENQQTVFIDIEHITEKVKVNDKTNKENQKVDDKKTEALSAEIKNKNIKLKKKISNDIKVKMHISVTDTKEKEENNKNVVFLKGTPSTKGKVETDNNEKSKHIKLTYLEKKVENLKEHKSDKEKQKFISIETKPKDTSVKQENKKNVRTNHLTKANSIKGEEKENKKPKVEHVKKTKFYAQIEKKSNHEYNVNLVKENQHKKKNLVSKNCATQKDSDKKVEDVKIKHIDTKDLEKPNNEKHIEILRDNNDKKNIKATLSNATKLETNKNNQIKVNHDLEPKQEIEIKSAKIKKVSFIKTKYKNNKKTLKVDTKKHYAVSIEKNLNQNAQKKDIYSQDNHQQNLTFNNKENIEFSKKLRNDTQKSTFINEIKDKTINHEDNKNQQINNTHIYTTSTQTDNINNQNQQVQTNQTNLHPPLDKVIKEIDKISNLKPPVTKSITLKLNPPHLGGLHLKVSLDAQKNLTASIAVHDKNTYKTIVNHIDSLKEYLVTNGIKVQNIDVHNSFNENFMNQFSNGSGNFQQQGQTNGNQTSSGFSYNSFDSETVQKESQTITQNRRVSGIDINA